MTIATDQWTDRIEQLTCELIATAARCPLCRSATGCTICQVFRNLGAALDSALQLAHEVHAGDELLAEEYAATADAGPGEGAGAATTVEPGTVSMLDDADDVTDLELAALGIVREDLVQEIWDRR